MEYQKVLDGLSMLLNTKGYGKGKNYGKNKKGFKASEELTSYLTILKQDFSQEVSTQFLFNLMKDNEALTNRQKRQKIRNLIRNLPTEKRAYFVRGLEVMKYHTDIIEYARDNKKAVYPNECELSEQEQKQIQELREIKEKTGLCLFNRAEANLNERQNRRTAINKGGKPFIRNVRTEHIGKEFIASTSKTFNFIQA